MTVSQLIKQLKKFEQVHRDREVRVLACETDEQALKPIDCVKYVGERNAVVIITQED